MPRKAFILLAFLPLWMGLSLGSVSAQLFINELMSSNGSTIQDEDGDYPDWVEIYNAGDEPVNLMGYGLSDRPNNPFKWRFPQWVIAPGEYLIVFASDKNRTTGPYLHTSWAISAEGEEIVLADSNGTILDRSDALPIPRDVSYGRKPDGGPDWFFFNQPTPGAPNTTEGYLNTLEPVVFSIGGGFYDNPVTLALSHPVPGTQIRYTLDGSVPTEASPLYQGPLQITDRTPQPNGISMIPTNSTNHWPPWKPAEENIRKATVVRASAFKTGYRQSRADAQTYFVGLGGVDRYQIPVVSISTDPSNLFDEAVGIYVPGLLYEPGNSFSGNYYGSGDEWERPASFEFFEPGGFRAYADNCGVRIHGGWSRSFPQKSFRLYFASRYGQDMLFYQIFPGNSVEAYKRVLLRNSGNDWWKAMMRDSVVQGLIGNDVLATQASRMSAVYVNGEYWGLLRLRERHDKYYLSTHYGVDPDAVDFLEYVNTVVEGSNESWVELLSYINQNDTAQPEVYSQISQQIDIDNYIDYLVTEIYSRNSDWPMNNNRFWRPQQPGAKWQWLIHDLDSGFGWTGEDNAVAHNTLGFALEVGLQDANNADSATFLFRNLLRNRSFREQFINRMADRLNTTFQPENVIAKIDQAQNELSPYMEEHIQRWGYPANYDKWLEEVDVLRDFARERPAWVRRHFEEFFSLNGSVEISLNVSPAGAGSVRVNSLSSDRIPLPWTGRYFREIPVTITAVPNEGFRFAGWQGADGASEVLTIIPNVDTAITAIFEPEEEQGGDQ